MHRGSVMAERGGHLYGFMVFKTMMCLDTNQMSDA